MVPAKPHDDLFEGPSMSFGDHLEELRVCLFRAVLGLALTTIIGFFLADRVVKFFERPLKLSLESYQLARAERDLKEAWGGAIPPELLQMLREQRLTPEHTQLDSQEVIEALRAMYPQQFGEVQISSYLFVPADLRPGRGQQLCNQLTAAGGSDAPSPGKEIWQQLGEQERKSLRELGEAPGELSAAQIGRLVAILNLAAGAKELHDGAEFKNLSGANAEATAKIRAGLATQFDPEQSRRLNKWLIAGLFSEDLRAPQVNMVPLKLWKSVKLKLVVLNAQEAFMIWMKAAMVTGIVIGFPWIFYQIWMFVAAGLYPHEKNYVYVYMPISILLFFGGAALAYLFVFEPVLNFLFCFNDSMDADFDPRLGEWLSFVLVLPLGFGIGFQLPLVMLLLNRLGLISLELYLDQWRIAILVIFIIAMVLTPADPYSMLLMAIPLSGLYAVGIGMCKWMPRARNPFAAAYEP